ncbi:hypothetical protein ACRCIY_13345, partial [Staphylococcus aureus]
LLIVGIVIMNQFNKNNLLLTDQKYLGHQSAIETLNFIGLENECEHSIYISLQL